MEELIHRYHLKCTPSRLLVLNAINNLGDEASIKKIINIINDVDHSTIYRIIDVFKSKGLIYSYINYNGNQIYAINEHSHYFTCIKCHKKELIDACPIEPIVDKLEKNNYQIINHMIRIEGICSTCNSK